MRFASDRRTKTGTPPPHALARFWRACWLACTHSLWMETAAAASHRSSFRRIASALPTPPLQRDPTPLLLACARAAREHPTISFRPVVRPVRPLSCPPNHTALKPSCGEIGAARRLSARCYEAPIRVRLSLGSSRSLRPQTTVRGSHQPFHHCGAHQRAPWQPTQPWTRRPSARQN